MKKPKMQNQRTKQQHTLPNKQRTLIKIIKKCLRYMAKPSKSYSEQYLIKMIIIGLNKLTKKNINKQNIQVLLMRPDVKKLMSIMESLQMDVVKKIKSQDLNHSQIKLRQKLWEVYLNKINQLWDGNLHDQKLIKKKKYVDYVMIYCKVRWNLSEEGIKRRLNLKKILNRGVSLSPDIGEPTLNNNINTNESPLSIAEELEPAFSKDSSSNSQLQSQSLSLQSIPPIEYLGQNLSEQSWLLEHDKNL